MLGLYIQCNWLACTGSHLAGNHHLTDQWYTYVMDLAIFYDILSTMGAPCGSFHLEIAELHCNLPLVGSPSPYVSGCGVDKLSKMVGNSASYAMWSG